ncbi:MAG TPA: TlpA disulfide reductase family protein [Nevskiaceae bacterium]|nr:TlpA disulfide reductase family protein [Nevskiaceae bacterium]
MLFALCASVLLTSAAASSSIPGIAPGSLAPEAAGEVLQGAPETKLSILRGKVVVLDFWASWCGPCVQSMPELDAIYRELQPQVAAGRFAMLGVSIDDDAALARRFLALHPVSYPIVDDMAGIAKQTYGIWRLPATMLIEPDGRVHFIYWGSHEGYGAEVKQKVLDLLAEIRWKEAHGGGAAQMSPVGGAPKFDPVPRAAPLMDPLPQPAAQQPMPLSPAPGQ